MIIPDVMWYMKQFKKKKKYNFFFQITFQEICIQFCEEKKKKMIAIIF